MKKLEISTTATHGWAAGFRVPVSRGSEGGLCLQPVRLRRDDVMTATTGSTADVVGGTTVANLPGPRSLAPPIT